MSENLSAAEIYAIHFENPEPKFYERMPNIIDSLTYTDKDKDGNEVKGRLSVYAKELYRIMKKFAAKSGMCWADTDLLAEEMNCSHGKVVQARKELIKSFHQLNGQPLIILREYTGKRKKRGCKPYKVEIVDVWAFNNAYCACLANGVQKADLDSDCGKNVDNLPTYEQSDDPISQNVTNKDFNQSKCDQLDPLISHNMTVTKQTSSTIQTYKKQNISPCQMLLLNQRFDECFSSQSKTMTWLMDFGFKEKVAGNILTNHRDLFEILCAADYLKQVIEQEKTQIKSTVTGYFLAILENKWYLNSQ